MDQALRDAAVDVSAGRPLAVQRGLAGARRVAGSRCRAAARRGARSSHLRATGDAYDRFLAARQDHTSAAELLHVELRDASARAQASLDTRRMVATARVSFGCRWLVVDGRRFPGLRAVAAEQGCLRG